MFRIEGSLIIECQARGKVCVILLINSSVLSKIQSGSSSHNDRFFAVTKRLMPSSQEQDRPRKRNLLRLVSIPLEHLFNLLRISHASPAIASPQLSPRL